MVGHTSFYAKMVLAKFGAPKIVIQIFEASFNKNVDFVYSRYPQRIRRSSACVPRGA